MSIENGDTHQFEALVSELVNYLDWISEAAETDLDNGDTESDAFEILNEIYHFTSSPSLDQLFSRLTPLSTKAVSKFIDTISFDLPKAVSKFIRVGGCLEIVHSIIDRDALKAVQLTKEVASGLLEKNWGLHFGLLSLHFIELVFLSRKW
ncbi:aberrant root formation protein 4 isoform X1 [Cucumis melo var. makuwa]|uniref:Aberrant root formation protein 4 isoform X1 n=1 Tax=Cucumis melo var. makuwa TaxID=1194695 RepID=A0A5A7UI91_CUCMM|nr:aberrant root formation protein 4 isoform X1 [Cucumis melo var. makuwa]